MKPSPERIAAAQTYAQWRLGDSSWATDFAHLLTGDVDDLKAEVFRMLDLDADDGDWGSRLSEDHDKFLRWAQA